MTETPDKKIIDLYMRVCAIRIGLKGIRHTGIENLPTLLDDLDSEAQKAHEIAGRMAERLTNQ